MASKSSDRPRRAALLAVAAALGAALVASRARLQRRAAARERTPRGDNPPERYRCGCGAEYRVSGADRHRVFWPADAPEDAPVLGDRCPACDASLPSGHETALT